jgi:hypothetical protein
MVSSWGQACWFVLLASLSSVVVIYFNDFSSHDSSICHFAHRIVLSSFYLFFAFFQLASIGSGHRVQPVFRPAQPTLFFFNFKSRPNVLASCYGHSVRSCGAYPLLSPYSARYPGTPHVSSAGRWLHLYCQPILPYRSFLVSSILTSLLIVWKQMMLLYPKRTPTNTCRSAPIYG